MLGELVDWMQRCWKSQRHSRRQAARGERAEVAQAGPVPGVE